MNHPVFSVINSSPLRGAVQELELEATKKTAT